MTLHTAEQKGLGVTGPGCQKKKSEQKLGKGNEGT